MTTDTLTRSVRRRHDTLSERFEIARTLPAEPDEPRDGRARIDPFLAGASRHLHTVDEVLVPAARRRCPDGKDVVHDYLDSARALEVVLSHVKAHEYGSVYERRFEWEDVWADVGSALGDQRRHEEDVADRLTRELDDMELAELADRMERREPIAPSRPHPYTPHTGVLGLVGRRVMAAADAFWDVAENRMVPEREKPPHRKPGLLGQYLLADPRFEEEEPQETGETEEPEETGETGGSGESPR